jgi:hypothetical protein
MSLASSADNVRAVADAVLYEGYLLYPYRSTSSKNQSRWQFGVLGPPGAASSGIGEEPGMSSEVLVRPDGDARLTIIVRCLQLQHRQLEAVVEGGYRPVDELVVAGTQWITWDEAIEREVELGPYSVDELLEGRAVPVDFDGGTDTEPLDEGRVIRTRWALHGVLDLSAQRVDGLVRVRINVRNTAEPATDKDTAIRTSFIGAHQILTIQGAQFVSLLEPSDEDTAAAAGCKHSRCFPVLAGLSGETDTVLVSPIILYDYPEVAEQSGGALFDSTEIDEILSLRIMTMTDEEKTQARATDPMAAAIIDRCDAMSPADMQQLHGILRDPHARLVPELEDDIPWWTEEADGTVQPDVDGVIVDGVRIAKGSMVRINPSRRADAQDLFYAGQIARVTLVHGDVDGEIHVGVVLVDDPASEMHEWYGRYLYFAPDELQPLSSEAARGKEVIQ